ncbi:MAG TPA: YidC/Oxa1 family membrane protein insertase [Anaerolineae bacterium]|nr:YidC/Oxa1 family membrane protein insertase [Anaerolineae bacterium]HID85197.1 YidC/Oxa1 family membrane protein insertase [Anaerolineales bacterium]HIQ08352.1 YidC/Oxa1 family membrane protein insertase [Anaerolineaceae bacterium]
MWNQFVVDPMLNVLLAIYNLLGGNFGLAIILFTILIRLIIYPLSRQQIQSAEAMQKLQQDPRWKKIQEKYKNNREKLAQEQMRLYQELGVNPFASCLPSIIQIPIIFGLYQAIIKALASTPTQMLDLTRHIYPMFDIASLIPLNSHFLWMDLGQPERLFIPGLNFGIPVLAILVGITTYLQSKMMPTTSTGGGQGEMMGQMMTIYMPLLLFYFTMAYAAGLGLYFFTSNLVTIAQYALMGKLDWQSLFGGKAKASR